MFTKKEVEPVAAPAEKKEPDTSQHGTIFGYRVEAMYEGRDPLKVGEQTFTRDWRAVGFVRGQCGVPIGHRFEAPWFETTHCFSYTAAEALRWWFHASVQADPNIFGGYGLRTRLAKYAIKYSVEATRDGEVAEVQNDRRVVPAPATESREDA